MEQNTLRKQRELTDRLNRYRNEYYNYNNPSVSDEVYDRLFDELHKLEQETGIQMSNSPTVTVGYPVVGKLEKTAHKIPLLVLHSLTAIVNLSGLRGASRRIGVLAGAIRWRNLASQNKRKNCVPAGQGNWIAVYFPQSLIHPALFADIYMSVSAQTVQEKIQPGV